MPLDFFGLMRLIEDFFLTLSKTLVQSNLRTIIELHTIQNNSTRLYAKTADSDKTRRERLMSRYI